RAGGHRPHRPLPRLGRVAHDQRRGDPGRGRPQRVLRRRDPSMGVFVLVHGGGQGGWCWKEGARVLRAQGHAGYAPTLTGFGERADVTAAGFETYVEDVGLVINFEDLSDVVLVGHSMAGGIVPRVAERMPGRIASVVWLAAVVTRDDET